MQGLRKPANIYLIFSGFAALIGGAVHIAAIFGGPSWYGFIGAPPRMIRSAAAGDFYPALVCLAIASVLFIWAAYAFSGAGIFRRLPLLRTVLVAVATVLIVRGVAFIPLMALRPSLFVGLCSCHGIDTFLVTTSVICFAVGVGYAVGACKAWRAWRY
jgi:hypothetical protein